MDHDSGRIRLDRTLFTATQYPAGDPRQEHLRDLHHLPQFDRPEIEHFLLIYKELEPGKSVEGASWADRAAAEAEVEASRRRLPEAQEPGPG